MKKAIIVSCFFNNITASRPKLVLDFLSRHYETTLLTADFNHSTKSYDNCLLENVKKIHVPPYRKTFSIGRVWSHTVFALKVTKEIRREKPELLYICIPPNLSGLRSAKLGRKLGAKVILDIVDLWPNPNSDHPRNGIIKVIHSIWRKLRDKAIAIADITIAECQLYKNHIKNQSQSIVIPLAKKENSISSECSTEDSNSIIIGYLGAFSSYSYDFHSMIKIASRLRRWYPKLEIIGEGERKQHILDMIDEAGIECVDYGAIYDETKKQEIMTRWHLGYNGYIEIATVGQSYKSLEYLSFGVPLLNSIKADTWELVEARKIGFNFVSDNLDVVSEAIDRITFSQLKDMKKNARLVFEELFSWDAYCENMKQVLIRIGEL